MFITYLVLTFQIFWFNVVTGMFVRALYMTTTEVEIGISDLSEQNLAPEFIEWKERIASIPGPTPERVLRKLKAEQKFYLKQLEFDEIITKFPNTKCLSDKERRLLHLLESRSEAFYGDLRWYNKTICEVTGYSTAALSRYLVKLTKLKYISVLSKSYHNKGKVYDNRVIRCKRIWAKYFFRITKNVWKHDHKDIRLAKNRKELKANIKANGLKPIPDLYKKEYSIWHHEDYLMSKGYLDREQRNWWMNYYEEGLGYSEDPEVTLYVTRVVGKTFNMGYAFYMNDKRFGAPSTWKEIQQRKQRSKKNTEIGKKIDERRRKRDSSSAAT